MELSRRIGAGGLDCLVNETAGDLRQLAGDHARADGGDGGVLQLQGKVLLHFLVRGQVHFAGHRHDMQRRQGVLVLPRFQQEGGGAYAGHDGLQRPLTRLPFAVVAVDEGEVLLEKRALSAAQQALVYDLALTENVLQPVAGKAAGQPPADRELVDDLVQRLEPFAAGIFEARQFVKDDAIKAQALLGQPLQRVVVGDDQLRAGLKGFEAARWWPQAQGNGQVRRPFGGFDRPDAGGNALGGQYQEAFGVACVQHIAHGHQRQRGLTRADRCQHQRPIPLVQEIGGCVLVGSKFHNAPPHCSAIAAAMPA